MSLMVVIACSSESSQREEEPMPDFDQHWNYNEPHTTEKKFREILISISLEKNPEEHLQLQTQIARTLGLQQKFTEAHAQLDEVQERLSNKTPLARIRYLLERGRVYNSSGEKEKALPLFLEAWDQGLASGSDFHAVDAAHMVAIAEAPENQLEWNEKAMALAEKSEDPQAKGWLGSLYNNIGWTYHDLGRYEEALAVFEKGFSWQKEHKRLQEMHIAKWCIGRTQRSLDNVALALRLQKDLAEEIKKAGLPEDGFVAEEIAECLLILDQPEAAQPYFEKAWTLLSKDPWLQKNETDRLQRLKTLGQVDDS
jgi:tetratricopeptide (TPR) repeat protein